MFRRASLLTILTKSWRKRRIRSGQPLSNNLQRMIWIVRILLIVRNRIRRRLVVEAIKTPRK